MPSRFLRCVLVRPSLPCLLVVSMSVLAACKRSEPPPAPSANPLQSQRDAMERAKGVGTTMQKGVDAEGRKADEESK